MSDYLLCIFILVGILLFLYASIMYEPISYWTRRRGYPTLGWKFLVMLPLWVGFLGTIAALCVGTNLILDDGDATHLVLPIIVLAAVCMSGSLLVLKLLPKRKMRITGSRSSMRTPYLLIGSAIVIVMGIYVILSIVHRLSFDAVINLIILTAAIGGMIYYLVSRANTPTVEEALSKDQRPPILYLRSFEQEATHFVEVSPEDAAKYSEAFLLTPNKSTNYHLTLEQFLTREIKNTIGPLIALGNPTDSLPPEGAYRTYAADGGWQEYFTDLSNRSAAILMQMGNSDNLNWELGSIQGRGLQKKLFVVTPPSNAFKYSLTGFYVRLTNRIKRIQPASWDKFPAILERAGYEPPAEDPGPGAVVTFDEHKRAVVLVSGAKTPAEYVGTIRKRIENSLMEELTIKIEQNPVTSAYLERGRAYRALHEFDNAISDFTHAIRMESNVDEKVEAYLERGFTYHNCKNDPKQAVADFDEAIRCDPGNSTSYSARGRAYETTGDYIRAMADYTKMIELDPLNSDGYFFRGMVHAKNGHYDSAIADLNEAIRIDPSVDSHYYGRGEVYLQTGDKSSAQRDFQKVLELDDAGKEYAQERLNELIPWWKRIGK